MSPDAVPVPREPDPPATTRLVELGFISIGSRRRRGSYPGGQAIISNVTHGRGGGRQKSERQPHATNDQRAITFAPGAPVRGEEPGRVAVPCTCCEGQGAMPDARRSARKRSAQG